MVGGTERPAIPGRPTDPGGTLLHARDSPENLLHAVCWSTTAAGAKSLRCSLSDRETTPRRPRRRAMPDKKPEKKKNSKKPKKQKPTTPAETPVPGKQRKA
jgi:hypothetical protein